MIFIVQTCPPRYPSPLLRQLVRQRDPLPAGPGIAPVRDNTGAGQLATMLRAFVGAGELGCPLTLLEDDVEVCADFVPFVLGHWRDPGMEVVQWYAPGTLPADASVNACGWRVEADGGGFGYLQATTFSPEFVRALLDYPGLGSFRRMHKHDGDRLVGEVLFSHGWRYAIRVPGGAQHTGADSLIHVHQNPLRRNRIEQAGIVSRHYVGRDGRMGG